MLLFPVETKTLCYPFAFYVGWFYSKGRYRLLDCSYTGSMAMPKVWCMYFWAGLCASFFLSTLFCWLNVAPHVYDLYTPSFWVNVLLFIDKIYLYIYIIFFSYACLLSISHGNSSM